MRLRPDGFAEPRRDEGDVYWSWTGLACPYLSQVTPLTKVQMRSACEPLLTRM